MAKKQARYLVLENEYCSDGVYMDIPVFTGTKLQCERYLYSEDHHNPMEVVLRSDYYTDEDQEITSDMGG
jgi:hypothetical protein